MKIIKSNESRTKAEIRPRNFELHYNRIAANNAGLDWEERNKDHIDTIFLESHSFPDLEGIYHVVTFEVDCLRL